MLVDERFHNCYKSVTHFAALTNRKLPLCEKLCRINVANVMVL